MANRLEISDEEWRVIYPLLAAHPSVRIAAEDEVSSLSGSDIGQAETLLELTPAGAEALIGDKGYDSEAFVQAIEARGMEAVIPPRRHRHAPRPVDWFAYKERHLIECFFNKIKHYRRIFSRFEKMARNYMGFLRFVSALLWLR